MKYSAVLLIASLSLVGTHAYAQDISPGPCTTEVTVIPGGAMFFVNGKTESSFGNYNLGGAFTYNVNRLVGLEGEVGGTLGLTQNLVFGTVTSSQKTPNTLGYTGNVVLSAAAHHGIVPYV